MSTPSQYVTVETSGAEGYSNLKTWLRDVAPVCPGVVRSVLKRQLILACREFFEQSFAWTGTMGPINIVEGQNTYALSPFNSYTDVVGVMRIEVNGVPIAPLYRRPNPIPNSLISPTPVTSPVPSGWYQLRPDIIALYPTPQTPLPNPTQMMVFVALRPKPSCEQVPLIAQTHFYEAILSGVLYRLLNQPAKPYSNLELSMYYEKRFRSYIGEYAGRAKTGFNGSAQWNFPRFGK